MDAVEPDLVRGVETAIRQLPAVQSVERLRLRWVGHQLQGDPRLALGADADRAEVKDEIRRAAQGAAPKLTDLAIDLIEGGEDLE